MAICGLPGLTLGLLEPALSEEPLFGKSFLGGGELCFERRLALESFKLVKFEAFAAAAELLLEAVETNIGSAALAAGGEVEALAHGMTLGLGAGAAAAHLAVGVALVERAFNSEEVH